MQVILCSFYFFLVCPSDPVPIFQQSGGLSKVQIICFNYWSFRSFLFFLFFLSSLLFRRLFYILSSSSLYCFSVILLFNSLLILGDFIHLNWLFFLLVLMSFLIFIISLFIFPFAFVLVLIIFLLGFLFKLLLCDFYPFEIVVKVFDDQ